MEKKNSIHMIVIALLIAAPWILVYFTNGTSAAYVHICYVPIFMSAYYWGVRGGGLAGLLVGLLFGPMMPLNVADHVAQSSTNWIIRVAAFTMIGGFVGYLFRTLIQSRNKIAEQRDSIENLGTKIIPSISQAVEIRDTYTNGHCQRVSDMGQYIGRKLNLSEEALLHLQWASIVHDVGKIGIPEEILNKPDKLTELERNIMNNHPLLGQSILDPVFDTTSIIDGVRHHHERLDGSGYPDGISGDEISIQSRIIAICDVWDALTSSRAYRGAIPYEEAVKIMGNGRNSHFDSEILDVFLEMLRTKPEVWRSHYAMEA